MTSIDLITNTKKGKTEVMLFGTPRKVKNQTIEIQHRFSTISQTSSYKYLGVKLDQTLQLGDHIDSVYKKASGRLSLMKRLRSNLTVSAALSIYKAMLLPIFTYCSIVTAVYSKSFEMKISRFEERAYVIIGRKSKATIRTIQKKRLCTQVYKCINKDTCKNFHSYFEIMTNNTRNKNYLLRLPKVKLEGTKKSFKFLGAKTFNKLPLVIRKATTKNDFTNQLNRYFKF